MGKPKKGQSLECIPCGREVIISSSGISRTTLWCCGRPMSRKGKAYRKPAGKTTTSKRPKRK